MALPESASVGTIVGAFVVGPSGAPDLGTVTFDPWPNQIAVDGVTIALPQVVATLDPSGLISVSLVATDDADNDPQGLAYRVSFALASGPRDAAWCTVPGGVTSDLEDVLIQYPPAVAGSGSGSGLPGPAGPVGASAYQVAVANGFVGDVTAWLLSLEGADGTDGTDGTNGADGDPGLSAYQVAVANGFVGDQAAWLASLVGPAGVDGTDGTNGADGAANVQVVAALPPLEEREPDTLYLVSPA
jgi:hypothetical protein